MPQVHAADLGCYDLRHRGGADEDVVSVGRPAHRNFEGVIEFYGLASFPRAAVRDAAVRASKDP